MMINATPLYVRYVDLRAHAYMHTYIYIYRCRYASIYLSIYLPIYLSMHPFIHPSIHPSIQPGSHRSISCVCIKRVKKVTKRELPMVRLA